MLKLENITVRFGVPENNPVVNDVSLTVESLDKIGIIGETGSGKSILLLAMLKMLPKSALVSGKLLFDNRDILQMNKKEIAGIRGKIISYVPQGSGNGLNPLLTIGYQVGETLIYHEKMKKQKAIERATDILRSFDIGNEEKIVQAYPYCLSGGMKQRVLIAMGIASGSPIIFIDEPTKGRDSRRVNMVVDSFKLLKDRTILCVTHDLQFARRIAEKILVMYASQQIEFADRDEFFREPLHPYSKALLQALPENGLCVNMGFAPPNNEYENINGCLFASRCPERNARCHLRPPLVDIYGRKVRCWNYVS
jgi:peptide/nickel transport system ATP-binding protein